MLRTLYALYLFIKFAVQLRVTKTAIPLSLANDVAGAFHNEKISAEHGMYILMEASKWEWLSIEDRTAYIEVAAALEQYHKTETLLDAVTKMVDGPCP